MKLKNLLKYRNIWMGIAILWIVLFHSGIPFSNPILKIIKANGYGGVDIFLFASGLGCYFSFTKNPDIKSFIQRRFIKIMPTYILFILVWFVFMWLMDGISINAIIGNLFCVQTITGNGSDFNWYISAMWILYFLTPYFVMVVDKVTTWKTCLLDIAILLIFSASFWNSSDLIVMVTRFPLFFLGMYFAKLSKEDKSLNVKQLLLIICSNIVGWALLIYLPYACGDKLWTHGLFWYPFLLVAPGICIGTSLVATRIENTRIGNLILKILGFIGKFTFEIFLVHILVFDTYKRYFIANGILEDEVKYWIIAIIFIIPICAILHYASERVKVLLKLK